MQPRRESELASTVQASVGCCRRDCAELPDVLPADCPESSRASSDVGALSGARPHTARTRRRLFSAAMVNPGNAALNAASPIIIDVMDVDRHTNIRTVSFMNDPSRAVAWAAELNGQ